MTFLRTEQRSARRRGRAPARLPGDADPCLKSPGACVASAKSSGTNADAGDDQVVINSVKVYEAEEHTYNFKTNEDGTYTVIIDGKEWSTVSDRTDGPFASMPAIPFEN